MKKKAYMAPEVEVHTIAVQQMICESGIRSLGGDSEVEQGQGDPEPSGGADARRYNNWDDEEEDFWLLSTKKWALRHYFEKKS